MAVVPKIIGKSPRLYPRDPDRVCVHGHKGTSFKRPLSDRRKEKTYWAWVCGTCRSERSHTTRNQYGIASKRAIAKLRTIDQTINLSTQRHLEADLVILNFLPRKVREAYDQVMAGSKRWGYSS